MMRIERSAKRSTDVDDNIWEYPFGELDDEDDLFCRKAKASGTSSSFPGEADQGPDPA
jgi:hypothetical protein